MANKNLWDSEKEERLISSMALKPATWDKKNPQHSNSYRLSIEWNDVIKAVQDSNIGKTQVKNKWKSLKELYFAEKVRIGPLISGAGADDDIRPVFEHYYAMDFLKDQAPNDSSGNLQELLASASTKKGSKSAKQAASSTPTCPPTPSTASTSKSSCTLESNASTCSFSTGIGFFLMNVMGYTAKLTDPNDSTAFKKGVLQLVQTALEEKKIKEYDDKDGEIEVVDFRLGSKIKISQMKQEKS